jgi:hypothetical protein
MWVDHHSLIVSTVGVGCVPLGKVRLGFGWVWIGLGLVLVG